MASSTHSGSAAVIWQGFRHLWRYNHRIHRIGSYVHHETLSGQTCQAHVVHTAATGTGPDTATCKDYFTVVKAEDVWFQPGSQRIKVITQEGVPTTFGQEVKLKLDPELAARKNQIVILNGFDLQADADPDKLNSFALRVAKMGFDHREATLSFWITGFLIVDCDTIECDLGLIQQRAQKLDRQVAAIEMGPEASPVELETEPINRPEVQSLLSEFQMGSAALSSADTSYTVQVHYMVVAGDDEHLHVFEPEMVTNDYAWDTRDEIFDVSHGTRPITIPRVDTRQYEASVLAFKHFYTYLKRPPGKQDLALHLLEWNITFRDIVAESGTLRADADLFFKNWSRGMKWTRLLWSLGALRHAGNAHVGASPTLLQFKRVHGFEASYVNHRIDWSARKGVDTSKVTVQV